MTCLANEQVAFSTRSVQRWFATHNVAYLEADWTRRNPAITEDLARFGRSGVPLYLYYPASGRDPVILPQILTPAIVIDALEAAERGAG